MKKCFVICPIGDEGSEIRKRSDQLLRHIITPVCKAAGFKVNRVDLMADNHSITNTIINELITSELVIADLSDHNANAFFELGYRSALNKPVIQIKNPNTSIPFDVGAIRTITYDLNDLDKVEQSKSSLANVINNIDFSATNDNREVGCDNQNELIIQNIEKIQQSIERLPFIMTQYNKNLVSDINKVITNKLDYSVQSGVEENFVWLDSMVPYKFSSKNYEAQIICVKDIESNGAFFTRGVSYTLKSDNSDLSSIQEVGYKLNSKFSFLNCIVSYSFSDIRSILSVFIYGDNNLIHSIANISSDYPNVAINSLSIKGYENLTFRFLTEFKDKYVYRDVVLAEAKLYK